MYCNTGWSRGVTCCAIVCAMKKGSGVPRQRWSLQSVVLIRAHKPNIKQYLVKAKLPCHFSSKRLEGKWHNWYSTSPFLYKTATIWGSTPGRPQVVNSAAIG